MTTSFDDPKAKTGIPDTIDEVLEQFDLGTTSVTPSTGLKIPVVPETLEALEKQWERGARPIDREAPYSPTGTDPDVATASVFIVNAKGDIFASSREDFDKISSKRQFAELLGFSPPDQELSAEKDVATIYFVGASGALQNKMVISASQVDRLFGPDEQVNAWDGGLDEGLGLRPGSGSDYELSGVRRFFERESGEFLGEKLVPPTLGGRPSRN